MAKRKAIREKFNKKLIPLMLMMVVPFIMYYQYIEYDTILTNPYYVTTDYYFDLFSIFVNSDGGQKVKKDYSSRDNWQYHYVPYSDKNKSGDNYYTLKLNNDDL